MHTENDYNITADRDINIEVRRNINITAAKDIKQTTAGGNWEIKVSADGKITCGGTSNITSKHHLETADKIDMNGPQRQQQQFIRHLQEHPSFQSLGRTRKLFLNLIQFLQQMQV